MRDFTTENRYEIGQAVSIGLEVFWLKKTKTLRPILYIASSTALKRILFSLRDLRRNVARQPHPNTLMWHVNHTRTHYATCATVPALGLEFLRSWDQDSRMRHVRTSRILYHCSVVVQLVYSFNQFVTTLPFTYTHPKFLLSFCRHIVRRLWYAWHGWATVSRLSVAGK